MSQLNGPAIWDRLLDAVGIPDAVVAGGCVRDYMLGVTPKDYDIFIRGDRAALSRVCLTLTREGLGDQTVMPWQGGYESYDDPLVAVSDGTILGLPANLIVNQRMDEGPDHLVKGFDFAIAQGWYAKGMGEPVLTDAARKDIADRTATLLCLRTYDRSRKRLDRYNIRHGGLLTLVDPFQRSFKFT